MKQFILILTVIVSLCSCESRSGHRLDGQYKAKASKLIWLPTSQQYASYGPEVYAVTVDTIFKSGDTVRLDEDGDTAVYVLK